MKVIFTIDTEPSIGGYFQDNDHTPLMDKPVSGDIHGQSEALGFLIRLFTEYGFKASFFIETVHNCYFSDKKMGHYVNLLKKADQDIQLHLHPVWKSFQKNKFIDDNCHTHKKDFLIEIMRHGKELIKKWTGSYPKALRTGNFSSGPVLYDAMQWAGLPVSSSICLSSFKPETADENFMAGVHKVKTVWEVPATTFYSRNLIGRVVARPLQITSIGHYEMIDILNQMEEAGHEVAIIVTHPFEFIKARDNRFNGMRVNRMVQKRARFLCDYLAHNADRFEVTSFSDLRPETLVNAPELPIGNVFHAYRRTCENVINDYIL